ncbi:MAG TPA: FHA domain-containing protein [Bryobacteraceae bacterium]|nr:FHA domain-containing protein [Bryobacteraceae bacterium]
MSLFRDIEKRIDSQLRKLFASENAEAQGRELVEIQRAILDEVEDKAQLLPRARRRFPYNDLVVRIAAAEPDRRSAIDIVFVEGDALQQEIIKHLHDEEIEVPADLRVRVEALEQAPAEIAAKGYHINYSTRETAKPDATAAPPAPARRTVRLTVLHGDAEQPTYELTRSRIHLGRLAEVLDERRRPVRRNDVVFRESADKPNSTVSRAHAHIEFDEASGEFRLFDDGSAYGTSVIHNGRLVNVPPAGGRGLRIVPGDEIYVGQARVLFETL